jgi:hypothetical protein
LSTETQSSEQELAVTIIGTIMNITKPQNRKLNKNENEILDLVHDLAKTYVEFNDNSPIFYSFKSKQNSGG